MTEQNTKKVIVIGAGPAGLTAAYRLCKAEVDSVVLEKDDVVGGLARTINYKSYHFDIGGHRFFTKSKVVEDMWHEVLGKDLLRRNRISRIFYNKRFFYYPLRASNALLGLGIWNSCLVLLSYFRSQISPEHPEETFDQWVSNRFGKRLYKIFFKTYTEKVWGIQCGQISAEWAAQRIRGLSLSAALKSAFLKPRNPRVGTIIKTLIDNFDYPRLGPGMMWEKVADIVQQMGSNVRLGAEVKRIFWSGNQVDGVQIDINGQIELVQGTHFVSSMPLREIIQKFEPAVPEEVLQAAMDLDYRDFLTVVLIINKRDVFPDNWIYIHDPDVEVGRIQNFKNWSPYMVPDPDKTCLGLEYFCFEGDGLWTMPDRELIELGRRELEILGLAQASDVEDGTVARMCKAYPVYDSTFHESLWVIRKFLKNFHNLQVIGRNGMHKYNNQDHSMLTAMLAVNNILGASNDLWKVNIDQEHHEEIMDYGEREIDEFEVVEATQPRVPIPVEKQPLPSVSDEIFMRVFAKMDKLASAIAVGSVCGVAVFIATLWLIIMGGGITDFGLHLLGEYFVGYTVTVKGAFIGMFYSFFWGFIWGWLFAYFRNFVFGFFIFVVRKRSDLLSLRDFFDNY